LRGRGELLQRCCRPALIISRILLDRWRLEPPRPPRCSRSPAGQNLAGSGHRCPWNPVGTPQPAELVLSSVPASTACSISIAWVAGGGRLSSVSQFARLGSGELPSFRIPPTSTSRSGRRRAGTFGMRRTTASALALALAAFMLLCGGTQASHPTHHHRFSARSPPKFNL
jgi:hypothetical protein